MTQKDYRAFAAEFSFQRKEGGRFAKLTSAEYLVVCKTCGEIFARDNARLDLDRFLRACNAV